ncbi:protein kinase domain-containing protein [Streptomyces sp. GLT-R25]
MAENPTEEPASPADPPRRPTSPPTRKQRSRSLPPKPEAPPTRVQAQGDPPPRVPSPATRKQGAQTPPPSPPTRRQRRPSAGEPTPPRPDDVPTLAGTDPPTRREARTAPRPEFPPGLLDRYEPYGVSGAGSEGIVWHVRRHADGTDAAVKISHPGQDMDLDTLEHLATPEFRRHVPAIHEFGEIAVGHSVCGWVAMEYLPTTLEDHLTQRLRDGKPREDRAHAERTVRELTDLLDFWQTHVNRNPLDLKPANILVRPRSSGSGTGIGSGTRKGSRHEFVVADFGGVAKFTASQSYRDFQITALYMAPEQIVNQNTKATPWWTVGLVLYQVFTGRPLYVLGDDARITDEAWARSLIVNHELDLSAVADDRQNLLLQGLLTKDPEDRWTAREVRRWLKGDDPPVVRPVAPAEAPAARHANRPITFRGTPHHEAESLAAAMAQHSQEAANWLAGPDGPRLATWLSEDLEDTSYDSGQLLALKRGPDKAVRAAVAALAFVAVFAPTATPQYRGRRVDAEGIARIAQGQGSVAFIEELLKANVPAVAAGFRCVHPECAGGRCVVLLALAEELPRTLDQVGAHARRLGRRTGGDGGNLDRLETQRAYGLAAMLIVHPEQRSQALVPLAGTPGPLSALLARMPVALIAFLVGLGSLRHRSAAVLRRHAQDGAFLRRWADLHHRAASGDVGTVTGRAALVAAAVLLPRAVRADALGQDHQVTLAEWWAVVWPPLVRRVASRSRAVPGALAAALLRDDAPGRARHRARLGGA